MMTEEDWLKYAEYYADEDEEGFDGVHYGGIKGVRPDAPKWALDAYLEYERKLAEGVKM